MTMIRTACPQLLQSKRRLHVSLGNKGVRCLQLFMLLAIGVLGPAFVPGFRPQYHKGPATGEICTGGCLSCMSGTFMGLLAGSSAQAAETATAQAEAGDPGVPLVLGALAILVGAGALTVLSFGGADAVEEVDDKQEVTEYFNGEGFNRWSKIYGETEDVNPVQKDIRVGHARTVDKILGWMDYINVKGKKVCDAGCGTGSLSIPLASRGAVVSGSDISSAMVTEAAERAKVALEGNAEAPMPQFETRDLERIEGQYDAVCCVDVLIHYPPEKLDAMVGNLAKLSRDKVILSFAPDTWYYKLLKGIGGLFPGPSKTTRAYLHKEEVVEAALKKAGFEIERWEMTSTSFYFSRLFQAKRVSASAPVDA